MEYHQCTPLITSDYGVDARGEVAEGRVAAATYPKSCRRNLSGHVSWPRRPTVADVDTSNVTPGLKVVGNSSQWRRASIKHICVEDLKRSDVTNIFCIVISLQDGYPKRIVKRAAGIQT